MPHQLRFRDLQNYTTLKLIKMMSQVILSFRDLQNYTTLKHTQIQTYH